MEKSNTDVKSGDRNECCAVGTGGGNETVSKTDMEKKTIGGSVGRYLQRQRDTCIEGYIHP